MNPNDIVKELVFNILVKRAITKVVVSLPFLGLPVVNPVFLYIAEKLYSVLYEELKEENQLMMMGIKTAAQEREYQAAVNEFKVVIKNGGNDEQIAKARDEFKNTLHKFISLRV